MAQARTSQNAALTLIFFLSGGSGLIFEIVWFRGLALTFGSATPAIATVVAAFMAGLALGNLAIGPLADRSTDPLKLYQRLEVGIGLTGLLVSLLFLRGEVVLEPLTRWVAGAGALGGPLRFALVFALMTVPTALMGGTLPVMARALHRSGATGRVLGWLYAVNTGGAVIGSLVPDLLTVPRVGLAATALLAALGNLVAALAVRSVKVDAPPVAPPQRRPLPRRALALYAASGFCALGYQIVWGRLLAMWSLSWIVSYSVLLAVFLASLAVGSQVGSRFADRVKDPLAWAGVLLVGTALAVAVPLLLSGPWLELLYTLQPAPEAGRVSQGFVLVRAALCSLYLEGPACLLMGAALPFLAAAAVPPGDVGRTSGLLLAGNTLAGVVGSLATGFLLIPWVGSQGAVLALSGVAVVVALGVLLGRGRALGAAAGLAAALVAGWALVPGDHLARAAFRVGPMDRVLAVEEGKSNTIAVAERGRFERPLYRDLLMPGAVMSGTNFPARRYMGMMAHLPQMLHGDATDALLICFGVGNTARSLLSHPELERLDIVDISAEVFTLSPHFAAITASDPLTDPRATPIADDGRHHLLTTDRRYDVITAEPPPPHNAGVVNLYSVEFYRTAKRALKPGGVLAQWLPAFQLSDRDSLVMISALAAEFEHVGLYYGFAHQWIIIGSDRPLDADPAVFARLAAVPSVQADLRATGSARVDSLVHARVQDDAGLRALVDGIPPLSDDLPLIQYPEEQLARPGLPPGLLAPSSDPVVQRVLDTLSSQSEGPPEWRELVASPISHAMNAEFPDDPSVHDLLGLDADALRVALDRLAEAPPHPEALLLLGRHRFHTGDYRGALAALQPLRPQDPSEVARYWLLVGGCRRALGDGAGAKEAFAMAGKASEHAPFRSVMLALIEQADAPFDPVKGPLVPR